MKKSSNRIIYNRDFINIEFKMIARITVYTILLTASLSIRTHCAPAAVAVPDKYAADVAAKILMAGGNAIDVAVAVGFSLAVTYPEAGNIGGGGFLTSFINGETAFLDFRESAPSRATRKMFLDNNDNFLQRRALIGGLASGVPGTVRGLREAHDRYGSLPWNILLAPAVKLAERGFRVDPSLEKSITNRRIDINGETNFSKYFGRARAGRLFTQPELASTLSVIAEDPDDFYRGSIAGKIVNQMQASDGLISLDDLEDYQAIWREPIKIKWRDFLVVTAPPPSSGGVALVQLLKMWDLTKKAGVTPLHNSAQHIHIMAEISKRVFADRAEYLGDPDFVDNRITELLDDEYLINRSKTVNHVAISSSPETSPGLESNDTTHFSIIDHEGNAVALTFTLNWEFGSGVVVHNAGFLLNNEMDDFASKPGTPNQFGVVGNEKNSIQPNKRMLSSMTPTLLLKENNAALVIGSPGGPTIFTSIFQALINLYDFKLPLQAAIDATRFHHQLPMAHTIVHDQRPIHEKIVNELNQLGYNVIENPWGNLGDLQAVSREKGVVKAATDNRGRGISRIIFENDH